MKTIIIFSVIGLTALLEGLIPTIASFGGITIPLTLASLMWAMRLTDSYQWPWLGLTAGLVMDLFTFNAFGVMSIYYTSFMYGMYLIEPTNKSDKKQWWIKILIGCIAAFIYPWYLLLVNGKFALASGEVAIIATQFSLAIALLGGAPFAITMLRRIN